MTGANIRAEVNGILTSGMVGIPVSIQYDEAWNGLTKNLVCKCGKWDPASDDTRSILNVGETAVVAHEIMQPKNILYLGIEGFSADGSLVIPTMWVNCGYIHPGAITGSDISATPALPVWAQLQTMIGDLAVLVQQQFNLDPFTNTLFLFCGRRRDRIKALYWEGNGFVLLYKRLESGYFQWPRKESEARALTPQQYRWLMEGLSVDQPKAHKPVSGLEIV